jgi:hypothetical protein
MPTLVELRDAVNALLDLPGMSAVLQLNSNTRERAFEAYLFGLFVRAVRRAANNDNNVVIKGIVSGANPSVVVLRGGPGRLGSRAQNFAYADCVLAQTTFEIHADVQYSGGSGAIHEIDISIYDHDVANQIRNSFRSENTFPATSKLFGAVECKFYDQDLGTSLGRTFVGLLDDCGMLIFKVFATNGNHSGLSKYFRLGRRPMRFFGLSPTNTVEESECISWLASEFRKWVAS